MAIEISMPKLGESVVEGTIGRWLKSVGDTIAIDEPLVEVDTDKVSAEIPSPVAGVITALLVAEGDTVAVGKPLALIEELAVTEAFAEVETEQSLPVDDLVASPPATGRPHPYTPAVRHLAQTTGIDPTDIRGTGNGGRVTRKDMENAATHSEASYPNLAAIANVSPSPAEEPIDTSPWMTPAGPVAAPTFDGDAVVPLSRMRRHIAARMVESKRIVPHAWTMVEVDVSSLVRFREAIKEEFQQREGFNLTYLPFVIKAAVEGLREYPILNSQWNEDRIVIKRRINIGIAVDLEDGLIVPVIKDADQKSIVGLARAVHDLATRARSGALKPDDVQEGTFTINNTGAFGSVMSAPIINYPQAAILSMETISRRPVVINDGIAIRSIMNLCVSLDHRILDGAVIGRFLRSVRRRLESYDNTTPIY